jgi:hypothetical protein
MPTFTNTFENGMRVDNSPALQNNSTYRYANGGRLAWNRMEDSTLDENIKAGESKVFVVARGNRYEFSITEGYKIVGSIDLLTGTVIFSTNGVNSEIGWLQYNNNINETGHVKYSTRYNDLYDPNFKNNITQRRTGFYDGGDKLNFRESNYINGYTVKENEFTERIYWADGLNQKRCVNIRDFFDEKGNPYHPENLSPGSFPLYPKYLSAHAMDARMDLVYGRIKFRKRIKGQLKSGLYQLCNRYVSKNGHESLWSPLDTTVFVTDQKMDGDLDGVANVYQRNHHNRTMGASNIMTEEGLEYEISGIDIRWDYIQVAYVYFATSTIFHECNKLDLIEIGTQRSITIQLTKHTGTAVTKDQLNQLNQTVLSVGTTEEQENRSWDGDLKLMGEVVIDTKNVKIEPVVRYFRPDVTIEPTFQPIENKVSGRKDNDPLTNTFPENNTIQIPNFDGDVEQYQVVNDYVNYKGQQFTKLLSGYPRGETQPFGIVFLDRKGNPLFVQHLQDFTFPNMYDSEEWTLSRKNMDGKFDLRILGAKVSGITIPRKVLYDDFGKLNVSGFMIVRTKRIPRKIAQGVLVNTVETGNGKTATDNDYLVQPQQYFDNSYAENPGGGKLDTPGSGDATIPPNSHAYFGVLASSYKDRTFNNSLDIARSSPGIFNFHSPDILIERPEITQQMLAGYMQHVGFIHKAYSERVDFGSAQYYTKAYRTTPLDWARYRTWITKGRPRLGDKSRIKFAFLHTKGPLDKYENFDPDQTGEDNPAKDYIPRAHAWLYQYSQNTTLIGALPPGPRQNDTSWHSGQQPYSAIVKLLDFKAADIIEEPWSRSSYRLVDWMVTPNEYYGEATQESESSSLETRRYIKTNHFQPITEQILDKAVKVYAGNGEVESYTFNGIEVWDGKHYVNLFDFSRLYPQYTDCVKFSNAYPDYSVSMIVPNESKYNLALMSGRRFAANAVHPQRDACTGEREQFSNGINFQQPEDWNYNEVLLQEGDTKQYLPKPSRVKIIQNREAGFGWSPKKLYGELNDSYRVQLPDDFSDALGQYGKIQRFVKAFDALYVIQEAGFGRMKTNLQTVIPTSDGGELNVKSGDVYGGIDPISLEYGTQHKNSIWAHDNQIGFVDANKGKLIVFAQNGFQRASEADQMDDPFMLLTIYFDKQIIHDQDNNKFIDIIAGYDKENKEAYTTFIHQLPPQPVAPNNRVNEVKSRTLVYNRENGFFHGFQPFSPHIYVNVGRYLMAPNNEPFKGHKVYLFNHGKYGQWFDKYYNTELEFIVNPQPNVEKVFDTGVLNVQEKGYDRISKIIHEIQGNIHNIVLAENNGATITRPDDRAYYEEHSLYYPMHEDDWMGAKERLRGKYLKVKIVIDNSQQAVDSQDKSPVLINFDTIFRSSYPIQY